MPCLDIALTEKQLGFLTEEADKAVRSVEDEARLLILEGLVNRGRLLSSVLPGDSVNFVEF